MMKYRSRQYHLHLFYFTCSILLVTIVTLLLKDADPQHFIKHAKEETFEYSDSPPKDKSVFIPPTTRPPLTLSELKKEAISALKSCSCLPPNRSNWLEGWMTKTMVVPNILHIVRYGDNPISFVEAACIKSYLLHQNPSKLYLHSNLVDLSHLGQYWDKLYHEKNLNLNEKLRVVMSRDPDEMNILGQSSVTPFTASLYSKFHVLNKYGGVHLDTNILLLQNIDSLRHLDFSTILFKNQTFSATDGAIVSATIKSSLVKDIMEIAKNGTEDNFVEDIETVVREDEVSAGKFWNIDPNKNTTDESGGMMSLRLEGQLLAMNETEMEDSDEPAAKIILEIWNRNETTQNMR